MKLKSLKLVVYDNPEEVVHRETMLKLESEADRQLVYGIELEVQFFHQFDTIMLNVK